MAKKNPWSDLLTAPTEEFKDDDGNPVAKLPPADVAPVRDGDAIARLLKAFSQRVPQRIDPGTAANPAPGPRGAPPPVDIMQATPAARPPMAPAPGAPSAAPVSRAPSSGAQQALLDQLNASVKKGFGKNLLPPPKPPAPGQDPSSRANRAVIATEPGSDGSVPPPIDASATPPPAMDPAQTAARLGSELPNVAPRSGQKRGAEIDQTTGTDNRKERATYLSGDEAKNLASTVEGLPFIQRQQAANDDRAQLLRVLLASKKPPQVDLSPLAAWVDSTVQNSRGGGQKSDMLAATTAAAKNRQSNNDTIAALSKQTATDNQNLTKDELEAFTKLKTGKDMTDAYSKLTGKATAENDDPFAGKNPFQAVTAWDHMTDHGLNSPQDRMAAEEIGNVQAILRSDNAIANQNLKVGMARLVAGSARIAQYEIVNGNPALGSQISQLAATIGSGELTPENLGLYRQFVGMLAQAHNHQRNIQAQRLRAIGGSHFGLPDDMVNAGLPGSFVNDVDPNSQYPGGVPSAPAPKGDSELNALLQERARRKKAGK